MLWVQFLRTTCEKSCLLPMRTSRVCCVSGPWLRSWLEIRWRPAARREGPAGYKGEKRAGEAAPRDPTPAGDPESGPRDDCEFKAATFVHIQQNTCSISHKHLYPHAVYVVYYNIVSASIRRHVFDKLLQVHSSFSVILTRGQWNHMQYSCLCRLIFFPLFPSFSCSLSLHH